MTNQEIFSKIQEILFDIKGNFELSENSSLIDEMILDSLEVINYLNQIEEVFGTEVSFDNFADNNLGIIKNMIAFLTSE